jgi:Domain of unknown function (DUF4832)/Beta-galactosidase
MIRYSIATAQARISFYSKQKFLSGTKKALLLETFFCSLALSMSAQTVIVRPIETQGILTNPGMGIQTFQRYNGDSLNTGVTWSEEGPVHQLDAPKKNLDFPASTVAYCRWHWTILQPEIGQINWNIIDLALLEAHRHGQRLAIRLMPYDPEHPLPQWYQKSGARRANSDSSKDGKIWQPDFSDPLYFKYWSALVDEFAKRYDGHPDLDSVDISTVGYWGEGWSQYMPEFSVQKKLIDVYLKDFHKTPLLMNFDEPEALAYGTSHGVGWRFDCLGDMKKPWSAMLDSYPEQIATTGIGDVWRTAPVSMETCGVPETWFRNGWDVDYILREALRWHISTINIKSSAIPIPWRGSFEELERRMGYRFALRRAEWQGQVQAGGALHLSTWWVNEGVAPIYRPFVLAFRLSSPEGSAVLRTNADLRKWIPGDTVFEDPLFAPEGLPTGEYTLSVALLDPDTLVPGVRLAIEGRNDDGWYPLGRIRVNKVP